MKHLPAILALVVLLTVGLACSGDGGDKKATNSVNTGTAATIKRSGSGRIGQNVQRRLI